MLVEGSRMADVSRAKSQHTRKGVATPPHVNGSGPPDVSDRLHSQGHVCNHARCAANNPDYAVKAVVPPKKFLVSKKHSYGGLNDKGEKQRPSTAPDHDRSHALHSLTNYVLPPRNGNPRPNGGFSKGRTAGEDRGLYGPAHSVLHHSRAWDKSSPDKKMPERKVRPTTSSANSGRVYSSGSAGRSSVTTNKSNNSAVRDQRQQKSRLSSASSLPSPTAEQITKWEDSLSPKSSITSISITQIISTRQGEKETQEEQVGLAGPESSPTASVGSNHDTEICSSKDTVAVVLDSQSLEQSLVPAAVLDSQSPGSETLSSNLQQHSVTEDTFDESLSPSSVACTTTVLESPTASISSNIITPTSNFTSTTTVKSCLATPSSEFPSSSLQESTVGHEFTCDSPTPSVFSRPNAQESLTSSIISSTSRPSPSSASSTPGRKALKTPPQSASKVSRKFTTSLKDCSKVGSAVSSSAAASAKKPSRISRSSLSPVPVDSALAPTAASRLAKKFISDLQASSVTRRPASTKGVRSIELRGGKAQSYSTTTVTSWNLTTTTVETSASVSESTPLKISSPGSSRSESAVVSIKPPWQSSTKESSNSSPNYSTATSGLAQEAPVTLKFAQRASTTVFDEVHSESEVVSLKHGEIAERRLSEEWMTDHTLEGVVNKIADKDHRVKVLVHAFETLATLSDSDGHSSEDMNPQLEYEAMSATPITA